MAEAKPAKIERNRHGRCILCGRFICREIHGYQDHDFVDTLFVEEPIQKASKPEVPELTYDFDRDWMQ